MSVKKHIDGGFTIWARQTIDSDIFFSKPDKWFKIWFFLVNKAGYKPGKKWGRGECHVTYSEIMQATKATKSEVDHCMRWLKSATMVATEKATRGMHILIKNYDIFQEASNYEATEKATDTAIEKRQKSDTINKKEKNKRNIYINKYKNENGKKPYSPEGDPMFHDKVKDEWRVKGAQGWVGYNGPAKNIVWR